MLNHIKYSDHRERERGMDGWMDGRTDGRMDGWIDRCVMCIYIYRYTMIYMYILHTLS
jgi:hypothetical protein